MLDSVSNLIGIDTVKKWHSFWIYGDNTEQILLEAEMG